MPRKTPSSVMPGMCERLREVEGKWDATRQCKRCEGTGKEAHWKWRISKDPAFQNVTEPCRDCNEIGFYCRPDLPALLDLVCSVVKGKVAMRSARPEHGNGVMARRAYYIWRLARFHGGVDVTLPMMASIGLGDDPYTKELEAVSEAFASVFFKTDMAAALRWGPLLGLCTEKEAHEYMKKNPQPMTAQPCGPVVLGQKPESEQMELH